MSFVTLFILTAATLWAAVCVAIRIRPEGRAELVLTSTLVWNGIVVLPIYGFGLLNRLYPGTIALGALLVSGFAVAGVSRGRSMRDLVAESAAAFSGMARLPKDALILAWRAKSLIFVGVVATLALLSWVMVTAYLAPGWRHYDCLWYHDSIVGFTLQNHGFRVVNLPGSLARVHAYPRVVEMTQLWFVLFTDRRLIDFANCFLSPGLAAGVYLLCRRFQGSRVVALGLACSFFWIPAACIQLQSTAVDLHTALLLIGALHFATRFPLRVRDGWMAGLALALAVAAKYTTALGVTIIALVAAARLIAAHGRTRRLATFGTLAGVFLLVCAMASTSYVRNYLHFGNPVWPHLVSSRWPGGIEKGQTPGSFGVDLNLPFSEVFEHLTALPHVQVPEGTPSQSYGIGVAFVLLPLVGLALFGIALELCSILVWRFFDPSALRSRRGREFVSALLLCGLSGVVFYTSPARWAARYNLMSVAVAMALVVWLCSRLRIPRVAEGYVVAVFFGGLLSAWWREPTFLVTFTEFKQLADTPFPLRETVLARGPTGTEFGVARETLIADGDIVAFNDLYGFFPSLLWNSKFSNRLVYVPSSPDYVAQAEALGAKWLFCDRNDETCNQLRAPNPRWESVGHASVESFGLVFHRRP